MSIGGEENKGWRKEDKRRTGMRNCRFKKLSSLAFVIQRQSLCERERERKERELLVCYGVDEVVEKKSKKKSEARARKRESFLYVLEWTKW